MKSAIRKARQLKAILRAGDEDALADSMLLQGILSGDVMAASFHVRQRLQRENLRLRRRLNMARIKTEAAKVRLLEIELYNRSKEPELVETTLNKIKQIYGLAPTVRRELPSITSEVILQG